MLFLEWFGKRCLERENLYSSQSYSLFISSLLNLFLLSFIAQDVPFPSLHQCPDLWSGPKWHKCGTGGPMEQWKQSGSVPKNMDKGTTTKNGGIKNMHQHPPGGLVRERDGREQKKDTDWLSVFITWPRSTSLYSPVFRKLINESAQVFFQIQNMAKDEEGRRGGIGKV